MGLFDIKRFIDRIKKEIPINEVISTLEKLPIDEISQNAGTYGGIFKIALLITDKAYQNMVPVEKRLSLTLMRIMVESASESLPYSVTKYKIDDLFSKEGNSKEFENIVLELFDSKDNTEESTVTYFPDHPVFIKFRILLKEGIERYNHKIGANISIPRFLTEFNSNLLIKLEEEKSSNQDLQILLRRWKVNTDFQKLSSYLRNARKMFSESNSIENRPLSKYYVENQTYIAGKGTWGYEEEAIVRKNEWVLNSFLTSNETMAIIAAPFGIGKSSLAKKMAYDCATNFIENPTDPHAYIPIFVPLRSALETTCNNTSLENDLKNITLFSSRKEDTNILVILDGLDELPENRPVNIHNIYTIVQGLIGTYPNRKFIITTRLEAGFPSLLNIEESYVRLFSFNENQIKEFFSKYDLLNDYNVIINILSKQKLGKPLFCWMIAEVYIKSTDEDREILFGHQKKDYLGEIFLYQQFIHNVILGKPKDVVRAQFEKWIKRSKDEKEMLRLIAFLKNDKPFLSKDKIEDYLDNMGFQPPTSTKSLLSTYFSISKDDQGKGKLEFTHKSFQEYLLAEYYVESIFNKKYHRLIGNDPSKETYYFINSFIKLLTDNDARIRNYAENFIKSFYKDDGNNDDVKLDDFIKTLRRNSFDFVKQKDLVPSPPKEESTLWNFTRLEYVDLKKLWVSRWITAYIAGNLLNEGISVDDDFLESASFFISNGSRLILNKDLKSVYLKGIRLDGVDLSNANLANANLTQASLSNANLANANLTQASLSNANLANAKLTNAKLTNANLANANLGGAILTEANLSGASLNRANLFFTQLNRAHLPNANLTGVDLSGVDLTGAHLSNANLTGVTLGDAELVGAYADLTGADLTGADLYSASLMNANFTRAHLNNTKLHSAKLSNANLKGADLTSSVLIYSDLTGADLTGADLTGADLTGADLYSASLMNANFTNASLMNANLTGADLTGTRLDNASLSNSILVSPSGYTDLIVNTNTNFSGCITDNAELIRYLEKNKVEDLPHEIKDKPELRKRLEKRTYAPGGHTVEVILNSSKLPDRLPTP